MKINNLTQLRELYDLPSGRAKVKVLSKLEKHAINFIETSPFIVVSTSSKNGQQDASLRGGNPGFVKVISDSQIIIPDAKGNNRLDSITNIVETGYVGLLFLIPGINETLRVNGAAYLSTDEQYLKLFASEKNKPKAAIVITIEEAFLHCAKAFMRSKLWDVSVQINRNEFPTMGQMLNDQLGSQETPETREAMEARYSKDL